MKKLADISQFESLASGQSADHSAVFNGIGSKILSSALTGAALLGGGKYVLDHNPRVVPVLKTMKEGKLSDYGSLIKMAITGDNYSEEAVDLDHRIVSTYITEYNDTMESLLQTALDGTVSKKDREKAKKKLLSMYHAGVSDNMPFSRAVQRGISRLGMADEDFDSYDN